jgi:hypothetical protein
VQQRRLEADDGCIMSVDKALLMPPLGLEPRTFGLEDALLQGCFQYLQAFGFAAMA